MPRSAPRSSRQAVDDELVRLQAQPAPSGVPATVSGPGRGAPVQTSGALGRTNGAPARANGTKGRTPMPATPNQVKAIHAIARRQNADLTGLLGDEFGVAMPEDLTLSQASAFIDRLNAASGT